MFLQPISGRSPRGAVTMGPEVGVGMNNRAVRNIENLSHGDGKESEGAKLGVFLEVIVGVSAYQNGSSFEAGEAL